MYPTNITLLLYTISHQHTRISFPTVTAQQWQSINTMVFDQPECRNQTNNYYFHIHNLTEPKLNHIQTSDKNTWPKTESLTKPNRRSIGYTPTIPIPSQNRSIETSKTTATRDSIQLIQTSAKQIIEYQSATELVHWIENPNPQFRN